MRVGRAGMTTAPFAPETVTGNGEAAAAAVLLGTLPAAVVLGALGDDVELHPTSAAASRATTMTRRFKVALLLSKPTGGLPVDRYVPRVFGRYQLARRPGLSSRRGTTVAGQRRVCTGLRWPV